MGLGLSGAQDKLHTYCASQGEQGGDEDQHGDAGVSLRSVPSVRGGGGGAGPAETPDAVHTAARGGGRRPMIGCLSQASTNRKRVENIAKRKLDSLMKESKIRDCEDPSDFTVSTLPPPGKLGPKAEAKKVRALRPRRGLPAAGRGAGT